MNCFLVRTITSSWCATFLASTYTWAVQADNIYARSVHMVYANNGTKHLADSNADIQQALEKVNGSVTALVPFLLNMPPDSIHQYKTMLDWISERNITIVPAVGGSTDNGGKLNSDTNQDIARAYRNISDDVRLVNLAEFYESDSVDVLPFIRFCFGTLGFSKIMLNPWPYASPGVLVDFTANQMQHIDATFQQVDNETWAINTKNFNNIMARMPAIQILVNYESPGPQQNLSSQEITNPRSSEDALKATLVHLKSLPAADNLNWCPPFTQSYDPLQFTPSTWDWIAGRL